jgi:hypothetical protein
MVSSETGVAKVCQAPRRRTDEADQIVLTGEGVIDGNGYAFVEPATST